MGALLSKVQAHSGPLDVHAALPAPQVMAKAPPAASAAMETSAGKADGLSIDEVLAQIPTDSMDVEAREALKGRLAAEQAAKRCRTA